MQCRGVLPHTMDMPDLTNNATTHQKKPITGKTCPLPRCSASGFPTPEVVPLAVPVVTFCQPSAPFEHKMQASLRPIARSRRSSNSLWESLASSCRAAQHFDSSRTAGAAASTKGWKRRRSPRTRRTSAKTPPSRTLQQSKCSHTAVRLSTVAYRGCRQCSCGTARQPAQQKALGVLFKSVEEAPRQQHCLPAQRWRARDWQSRAFDRGGACCHQAEGAKLRTLCLSELQLHLHC